MTEARRLRVTGKVQGVFYRAWTRDKASALGVAGTVRNCSDGSVEAAVEGDPAALDALVKAMRHGPSGARVENIAEEPAEPTGAGSFRIVR